MPDQAPGVSRRLSHTRAIRIQAFERDDGLWDFEAELTDEKAYDFPLASGVRPAGEPVHRMRFDLTIDRRFEIVAFKASSTHVPYPGYCDTVNPDYSRLVGCNLVKDFRATLRERFAGTAGCTHLSDLAALLPTAAVQAFAGPVIPTRDSAQVAEQADAGRPEGGEERRPFQIDRCHALRAEGPAVARFYPRWHLAGTPDEPPADPLRTTP